MAHFQDIPTGYKGANHNDRVGEEMVDVTQEVEQEIIATSRQDREVRNQVRV